MKLEITKHYAQKTVFDAFSLDVEEGKITAILGESGSGKTTLLNIVAGLIPNEGGVVERRPYGYIFQTPRLLPHLTVEENLKFALPKEVQDRIPAMLERVGLGGQGKRRPQTLSGGEAQRVAIVRAFLTPHELLLLDEPFSSLDLSSKKSLLELFSEVWKQTGSTVLFVTHDVREAALAAHRAVVIRNGGIVDDVNISGEPVRNFFAEIPEEKRLIRALLGE